MLSPYKSPQKLVSLFRVVFFCTVFVVHVNDYSSLMIYARSDDFWHNTFWFELFGIEKFQFQTAEWMRTIYLSALVATALGLFTRFSSFISFLSGTFLHNSWSAITGPIHAFEHSLGIPLILMLCMSVFRTNEFWSLDKVIFRKMKPVEKVEYLWLISSVRIITVTPFFFSSINRLSTNGFGHLVSKNFETIILLKHDYQCSIQDPGISCLILAEIINWPSLILISYLLTQVLEFFSPLALYGGAFRQIIGSGLLLFQISAYFVLGENFIIFLPIYLLWIPQITANGVWLLPKNREVCLL